MRQNLQSEINHIEIINPTTGNVSKNLSFHTGHTGFMHQRNTTNNDNRRQFVIQNIISHISEKVITSYRFKH